MKKTIARDQREVFLRLKTCQRANGTIGLSRFYTNQNVPSPYDVVEGINKQNFS